jgi:hypothetical protein
MKPRPRLTQGGLVVREPRVSQSASVMSSTRRTETPARYISISASSAELSRRRLGLGVGQANRGELIRGHRFRASSRRAPSSRSDRRARSTSVARWPFGSRDTCESCKSIDVRRWQRQGFLREGEGLRCDELTGNIRVRTERDAVVLSYRVRGLLDAVWKSIEQRVPLTWTACHFGGKRPWFVCSVCANGRYCGRRVAVLYLAGDSFACRQCYGLAYESQQGGLLFPQDHDCRRAAF